MLKPLTRLQNSPKSFFSDSSLDVLERPDPSNRGIPGQPDQDYQVLIWDRVDDIDPYAWNSVRDEEDLHTDLRLLRVVESSLSSLAKFRYLLIRDRYERPVAISPLSTYVVDGGVLATNRLYLKFLGLLNRVAPFVTHNRTMFCGLPFSSASSQLRISEQADSIEVLRILDRTLVGLARDDGAKCIVWKEFTPETTARLSGLESLGYRQFDSLPLNVLQLTTSSYDDHLAQLSRKKRYEIRRTQRRLQDCRFRMLTTSNVEVIEQLLGKEAHRLYLQVIGQSSTVFETLPLEFFLEIARQLPDSSEFMFCLDENDRVLAFSCSLHYGEFYQGLFCGIDYERDREAELYFNTLFRMVEDAFRRRKTTTLVGQNADDCKNWKLGTRQIPLSGFIKGTDWLMQLELKLFGSLLFPDRPLKYPKP